MKNIFLSRPNWVSPEFQSGVNNFLTLLKSYKLSPRTIGSTDYPNKSPMDAVIELLYECEGAIILGYPQIDITQGTIKNIKVENTIQLATEWNHIEAGLAHALELPLLLIHHTNVCRGVFDRGVLNNFVYQKDLSDSSWGISDDIVGALTKWKSNLKPIFKKSTVSRQREEIEVKWGCFQFPPDTKLYCPMCYNNRAEKMLTIRVDSRSRRCTSCEKNIPTG